MYTLDKNIFNKLSVNLLLESESNSKVVLAEKIKGIPSDELKSGFIKVFNSATDAEKDSIYRYMDDFVEPLKVRGTISIPTTDRSIWEKIAKIKASAIGRGELYIYLRTKNAKFSGGAGKESFDLEINGEDWEVKEIEGTKGTNFRLGQKGLMNKYKVFQNLFDTIKILNNVYDLFDTSEEVKKEIAALNQNLYRKISAYADDFDSRTEALPMAISKGNLSKKGEAYLKSIKKEVDTALEAIKDDQKRFTLSKLLGKGIKNLNKRIVPLDPSDIERDNGAVLDFLEDETLDILEMLTQLPEFQEDADIEAELNSASENIKSTLVNTFFMTKDTLNILKVTDDQILDSIERVSIAGGNMQMRIKPEEFDRQTGEKTSQRLTNRNRLGRR